MPPSELRDIGEHNRERRTANDSFGNAGAPMPPRPHSSQRLFSRATTLVIILLLLIGLGTTGFHVIEGWSWFKSLYATLMTIATIGADPLNQLSPQGQMFNAILIVLGVAVVGFAIGSLTQAMVEFQLGSFFGRRRMEKEISRLQDHFIVCGAGRVGRRIALEIAGRGLPVAIVEKEAPRAAWAQEHNIPVIIGDASSEAVLRDAHISQAKGLASAVTSDAQNVYIVLTARGLKPDLYIIARASEEDAESKLMRAGASAVISPYHYAGESMARMMTRPNVQSFLDLALAGAGKGGLGLQIEEIRVAGGSKLAGSSVAQAGISRSQRVVILAVRRQQGGLEFNPGSGQAIAAGDFLIAMGDPREMRELEALAGAG